MPIYTHIQIQEIECFLWHIAEQPESILCQLFTTELEKKEYEEINHPKRKQEWLASRLALQSLITKSGYSYSGLSKDAFGKPYLNDNIHLNVSISHCASFALAAVSHIRKIGVDVQEISERPYNLREKFLNQKEIECSGSDKEKLCILWCAKEAIYKAYPTNIPSLRDNISLDNFDKENQGMLQGSIYNTKYIVYYRVDSGYALAWAVPKT